MCLAATVIRQIQVHRTDYIVNIYCYQLYVKFGCAKSRLSSPFSSFKKIKNTIRMDGVFLATPNGLEPSTSSVTGWRANRLHHRAIFRCGTLEIIAEKKPFVKTQNKKFSLKIKMFPSDFIGS